MLTKIALSSIVILAVVGCSDPKSANKKNFTAAIQTTLDTVYPRCYVKSNFPKTTPAIGPYHKNSDLEALVAAGLLAVTPQTREASEQITFLSKIRTFTVNELVYNLTPEGEKHYKKDGAKDLFGKPIGGFCIGKGTVKEITEFTEPADMGGARASRVNYTYEVSEIPDWAKLPATISAIPKLKDDVESVHTPIKSIDMLLLTNNGWKSQLGGLIFQ